MQIKEPRNISYLASVLFHLLLLLIFMFVRMSADTPAEEYLLVGFGSGSGMGNPSEVGNTKTEEKNSPKPEKTIDKKEKVKKVDLPKARQTDDNNIADRNEKVKEKTDDSKVKPILQGENKKTGSEIGGEGEGGFGFELDFGGKGKRRIYSYNLPEYPEGVAKEIDVKLKFTILPDGTVSRIIPLIKADARLELAAINSLRQWRFEPIPATAKQVDQTVVITFPYRLQ